MTIQVKNYKSFSYHTSWTIYNFSLKVRVHVHQEKESKEKNSSSHSWVKESAQVLNDIAILSYDYNKKHFS